jgi:hypothetical protein
MRDANYLRAQAELCLETARQISDHATAEDLRAEAARYQDEAAAVETVNRSHKVYLLLMSASGHKQTFAPRKAA